MKLIVTIDTEEDNWGMYSPAGQTVENIKKVPVLQQLFDDVQVTPTYLITYPVAADEASIAILKPIFDQGRCEIGAQCHPWNTPPFDPSKDASSRRNSMLCNLPVEIQLRKITSLHETILRNFGMEPTSFRSGRWGFSSDVSKCLYKLGYTIDTSILPYSDWSDWSHEYGPNFSDISPKPYRFFPETPFVESAHGPLVEIPATVGYLQQNFKLCSKISRLFMKKPISRLKLAGILHRLGWLNRIWLSPEVSNSAEMIKLARRMKSNGYPLINLFFHSPALLAGLTPFVRTKEDEHQIVSRIKEFLAFTRNEGIESIRLSDMAGYRCDV